MLTRTLTAVVAALPSAIKYKTRWLKPLYTSVLAWREPFFKVETGAGAITWHIDALTTQAYIRGAHEPHMQSSFLRLLRPGSVVYDVGAHLGFHALFCGLAVGPSGRVIAFEPDPLCRESLSRQVAANPNLPVAVLPYALSDRHAQLHFYSSRGSGQSRIHAEGKLVVEATTIDTLVGAGEIPKPDLIKIDVEGHEGAVLRGATATLLRHRPVILCDYNDGTTLDVVRDFLKPLGYEVSSGPPITGMVA
ncbi:MAG: FkbM family methyltransferase [Terriglobales bacterium]